jgi:hypothetical protein
MADSVMKASTELSALVPELWSSRFHPTLLEALPFNDLISKDYEGEISSLGDIVNITRFPQFGEAVAIGEADRVDADSITASNIQLVINNEVVKDFIVTSRALKQSIDAVDALLDLAMHAIMKKMQSLIIAAIVPNSSAPDHSIAYDSSTTLQLADILEAKELLDGADVPDDGSRAMVLGAPQWNDLFNISGFTSRDFVQGSAMSSGQISYPILGFNGKMTSEAGNVSYLFHPLFMTMAVQQAPEMKVFDLGVEGKRAQRWNTSVLFGLKQLDGLRVVTIG